MKKNFTRNFQNAFVMLGMVLAFTSCVKDPIKPTEISETKKTIDAVETDGTFSVNPIFLWKGGVNVQKGKPIRFYIDFSLERGSEEDGDVIKEIRIEVKQNGVQPWIIKSIKRSLKDWPKEEKTWNGQVLIELESELYTKTTGFSSVYLTHKAGQISGGAYNGFYTVFTDRNTIANEGRFPLNDKRYIYLNGEKSKTFSGFNLLAKNGIYELYAQGDGNLVLYKTDGTILWASDTSWGGAGYTIFDNYGQLSQYGSNNGRTFVAYGSPFQEYPDALWVLQDDGNFVAYAGCYIDPDGTVKASLPALYATGTAGGRRSSHYGRMVIL